MCNNSGILLRSPRCIQIIYQNWLLTSYMTSLLDWRSKELFDYSCWFYRLPINYGAWMIDFKYPLKKISNHLHKEINIAGHPTSHSISSEWWTWDLVPNCHQSMQSPHAPEGPLTISDDPTTRLRLKWCIRVSYGPWDINPPIQLIYLLRCTIITYLY